MYICAVMQFYAKLLLCVLCTVHAAIRSVVALAVLYQKLLKRREKWKKMFSFGGGGDCCYGFSECARLVCLQNILKLQKDFKTISHRDVVFMHALLLHICIYFVCHSFLPDRHIFLCAYVRATVQLVLHVWLR